MTIAICRLVLIVRSWKVENPMVIYFVVALLFIATGIIATIGVATSNVIRGSVKSLLTSLFAVSFIVTPVFFLLMVMPFSPWYFGYGFYRLASFGMLIAQGLSFALAIAVAIRLHRRRTDRAVPSPSSLDQDGASQPDACSPDEDPIDALVERTWKTTGLTPKVKHSTQRRREWAFLIDIAPGLVYLAILGISISANFIGLNDPLFSTLGVFTFLFLMCYIPLKDSFDGLSLGKRITNCRVVDFKTGQPTGLRESVGRNMLLLIPGFFLVEFVILSIRPDNRRLGDLMARTTVVKGPPQFAYGVEVPVEAEPMVAPVKHPLD